MLLLVPAALAQDVPAGGAPVALGMKLGEETCRLARARRGPDGLDLDPVAAALARWARTPLASGADAPGTVVAVPDTTAPCVGGPPIRRLELPAAGGWAIGLTHAPTAITASFPVEQVVAIGRDRMWWHVPTVAGEVAFEFGPGLPPALFELVPDPAKAAPDGWTVTLGEGEVQAIAAEGSPIASALEPAGVAAVRELGGKLVVVGLSAGITDGQVREGTAAALPIHVAVTPPMRPPDGVVVNVGASKKVHLPPDAPAAREVASVDPEVAEVVPEDGGFTVRGVRAGRTAVLWLDDAGAVRVLAVVVGGR
jgi:hypothetical protein